MNRLTKNGLRDLGFLLLMLPAIHLCYGKDKDIDVSAAQKAADLPDSRFLSEQTKAALSQRKIDIAKMNESFKKCISPDSTIDKQCINQEFYQSDIYTALREKYAVTVKTKKIGGVWTEIFTPKEGVLEKNRDLVLIELHGGNFSGGDRKISHWESIPLASVGKIKVVSVDYRLAPEHQYPAATQDVVAVYRALLRDYKPENIGLVGFSAGGILATQTIASLQKEKLPRPGAIGLINCGASPWGGDSSQLILGKSISRPELFDYFKSTDMRDPLVTPAESDTVLEQFPPVLLVSATRSPFLSSQVHSHRQFTRLGVDADLQIWEGMGPSFMSDYTLPESEEFYLVATQFFDRHLGGE